jgi:uroporphyrinogen decarboxylase
MSTTLPLRRPAPDARLWTDTLMGRSRSEVPPLVEYLVDDVVQRPIVTGLLGRQWAPWGPDHESQAAYLDNFIEFWLRLGYDIVRFEVGLPFAERHLEAADPVKGSDKVREWSDQHRGVITSWADFERFPWPKVGEFDFFPYEYLDAHLPPGMGLVVSHGGGIYEHLSHLMSYEGLCLALADDPKLVEAVAGRVGGLLEEFYRHLLGLERLTALFQGDDMGFKTGTLISPDTLRRCTLPWHKRFAAMAHAKGLPYFLHSCGNLGEIMEDLVADVGIDGKHSYEDVIMPVGRFQERWGGRIAVLGGLDINVLSGASPAEVRRATGRLMDECGARGRYAVGSGNSVPSYVPPANYLAMVEEAVRRRGLA